MAFRPLAPTPALLALLVLTATAARAAPEGRLAVVSGGEVALEGGERVCFRLDPEAAGETEVRVQLRFTSRVPRGWLELDGVAGPDFSLPQETVTFRVDPRGVHRLMVVLEEEATVDRLLVLTDGIAPGQASCRLYEDRRAQRVERAPEPVDRLERPDSSAPPAPAPASEPAASDSPLTAQTGTELGFVLDRELGTRHGYAGQAFTAKLAQPLFVGGRELLPDGTRVRGRIAESKDAGRFGRSTLRLDFQRALLPDGRELVMSATLQEVGTGDAKKQGAIIAGSALGGAIVGKVLGGDAGSGFWGAVTGGAIAAGSIAAEPGESVVLPAGTLMTVRLDAPLTGP